MYRMMPVDVILSWNFVLSWNLMFSICTIGTNSSLTAAVVVVTGLVGANFVQATLDKLRFRDPIARGIATASRYVILWLIIGHYAPFSWH